MTTSSPKKSLPPLYVADGNCMNIPHIGTIDTPSLSLSHTYCSGFADGTDDCSHPFFIDIFVKNSPLSESTPDTELAQSTHAAANPNQSSISNVVFKPTLDNFVCRYTQALEKTHTWDYVDLPPDKRPIGCNLLVVVAAKQWNLLQMNVKNAFLNGTLSEEVYMKPPPGTSPLLTSTELEYRALADANIELLWLRWLLTDIGVHQQGSHPPSL
ncbi:putative mitochondrial protein [Cucumis melo var. makuwa]|uniref:Putative mitochondrial protein n=1 Tax=Cucumis melo var. makuwa TaxID=1194695 RepID=A0A5D3C0S4_CUCMM|nr:putative mitochondrial protein [Cucumis melo var. makuwa]